MPNRNLSVLQAVNLTPEVDLRNPKVCEHLYGLAVALFPEELDAVSVWVREKEMGAKQMRGDRALQNDVEVTLAVPMPKGLYHYLCDVSAQPSPVAPEPSHPVAPEPSHPEVVWVRRECADGSTHGMFPNWASYTMAVQNALFMHGVCKEGLKRFITLLDISGYKDHPVSVKLRELDSFSSRCLDDREKAQVKYLRSQIFNLLPSVT